MAAAFTLGVGPFPAGATVGAYRRRAFVGEAGPFADPVESAVTSSALTTAFDALEFDTEYWAAAQVGGVWRRVAFRTEADPEAEAATKGYVGTVASLKANLPVNVADYATAFVPFNTPLDKAISVLGIDGGTIQLPRGTHTIAGQLDLSLKKHIEFVGEGSVRDINGGTATVLNFTGDPGVGNGQINLRSAKSITFRNLVVLNSHPTFNGYLVDCQNGAGTGATDTCFITFDHVTFFGGAANRSPAAAVYLRNSHTIKFLGCSFFDCQVGVIGRTLNTEYAIAIDFDKCVWTNNVVAHVKNAGQHIPTVGGASWNFSNCVFEHLSDLSAGAYKHDPGVLAHGLTFDSCWFGDATSGTGAQITFAGFCLNVTNCRLGSESAGASVIVIDENDCENIWVVGNYVVGPVATPLLAVIDFGATTGHGGIVCSNYKEGVNSEFTGTIPITAVEIGKYGIILGGDVGIYKGGADLLEVAASLHAVGHIDADTYLQSYAGTTAACLFGNNGGQPGIFMGLAQDVILTRVGSTVPTAKSQSPFTLPTFTMATRPAAADVSAGTVIFVSDGGAGAVFQGSTGAAWVNLG